MPTFVFLFGAGASFGSDTHGTPPLGETLFDSLQSFNPNGWGALSPNFEDLFRNDFEEGMRQLSEMLPQTMPPLQRAMAAYFFIFIPRSSNLFVNLARKISQVQRWDGTLVTLNYDRLLELSLLHSNIQPVVNREPSNENEIELCLPHGCCHLFCESVRGNARGINMSGTGIQTSGPVIPISNPDSFNTRIRTDAFPPVMSYFEPHKRTLSGVNFIKSQRDRWRIIANDASVIALVGIKVRPHDDHIWDPLKNTTARLVYCSGYEASIEFNEWANDARPQGDDLILRSYFAEAFNSLSAELGLD